MQHRNPRAPRPAGRRLAGLLLALLLLGSCVEDRAASGPLVPLVPEGALAAIVVERPARLYAGLEAFWEALSLEESLGMGLSSLFQGLGPAAAAIEPLLDTARPLAFALLPGEGGSGLSSTRPVVYLPFKGRPEALRQALEGGASILALDSGYAVLSTGGGEIEFPPRRPADLSALKRYPAEALKLWVSPAIFEALKKAPGFAGFQDGVRGMVRGGPAEGEAELEAFAAMGKALLGEIAALDAAILPGRSGLDIRLGLGAREGGGVEAFLAKAAAGPSALEWSSKVGADSLYAFSWSLAPELSAELGIAYLRFLASAFEGQEEFAGLGKSLERLGGLQREFAAATGARGAYGLDLELDAARLKGIDAAGEEEALELLEEAVELRLEFLQEVRNEAAYRALMKRYASDPELLSFMDALTREAGLLFRLKLEDKRLGSFPYSELSFDLEVRDPEKLGEGAEAIPKVNELLEKLLSFRYALSKGAMAMTTGDPAALKALAERAAAPRSLAADPGFKAYASAIPSPVQLVGSFSTRRLAALVKPFLPEAAASSLDPARFGAWYSYAAARPRAEGRGAGFETGFALPASDLAALVEIFASLKSQAPEAEDQEL